MSAAPLDDPLLDNAVITPLAFRYKTTEDEAEREQLFGQIAAMVVPLIEAMIFRYRWDLSLGESCDDLVSTVIVRLPRILAGWKMEKGTAFGGYFLIAMLNSFRKTYAKRQRRSRYEGDFPTEEIADSHTERLNGKVTTMAQRGHEFERAIFLIPGELAALVDPEYSGLVRYVAERYLQRADNDEPLYFASLRREVNALPISKSLSEREIDSLIRMVIAGVRARLYSLRSSDEGEEDAVASVGLGFLCHPEGSPTRIGFLSRSTPRIWPLLLILDPPRTRLLLHCLAGVHESVPARDKWVRQKENGAEPCPVNGRSVYANGES